MGIINMFQSSKKVSENMVMMRREMENIKKKKLNKTYRAENYHIRKKFNILDWKILKK